jgi:uncharacterized membrane protein YedE/YeeE
MNFANLLIGAGFGFLLSRAGATHFDYYAQLFLFQNLQLLWVIVTAVAIGVPGVLLLKKTRTKSLLSQEPIHFEERKMQKGLVTGALIFGVGWGMTGSCPGSILAMIGEGKMAVIPTFAGMLAGTYFYGWFKSRQANTGGSKIATCPTSENG